MAVHLEGEFGIELRQILMWKEPVPVGRGEKVTLWQEFSLPGSTFAGANTIRELVMCVRLYTDGGEQRIAREWRFNLLGAGDEPFESEPMPADGDLCVTLLASGYGEVVIGPLHCRFGTTEYLREVTDNHEEILYKFMPCEAFSYKGVPTADMRAQNRVLNVCFSDYCPDEAPEGDDRMWSLGAAYLLIADPRGSGGYFYKNKAGDASYESEVRDLIERAMDYLGLSSDRLIMTGVSMGGYAALYYGAQMGAAAIVLEKPVLHPGRMAINEKSVRPGTFPQSLEMAYYMAGGIEPEKLGTLDEALWDVVGASNLSGTEIAVAYMRRDDFDPDAFETLVDKTYESGASVYGKSFAGRHLDDAKELMDWAMEQHRQIIERCL